MNDETMDLATALVVAREGSTRKFEAEALSVLAAEVDRLQAVETRAQFIVDNPAPHAPADAAIRKSMRYVLRGEN